MRSATCALSGCHACAIQQAAPLSFSLTFFLPAMQRDIHRPASTRYAVLYGLPVSLSTSANRFLARSISFAGVFCDFLMKTRSMMILLPLWYTQIPRYVRPHRADLKVHRPGLRVRLPQ